MCRLREAVPGICSGPAVMAPCQMVIQIFQVQQRGLEEVIKGFLLNCSCQVEFYFFALKSPNEQTRG